MFALDIMGYWGKYLEEKNGLILKSLTCPVKYRQFLEDLVINPASKTLSRVFQHRTRWDSVGWIADLLTVRFLFL